VVQPQAPPPIRSRKHPVQRLAAIALVGSILPALTPALAQTQTATKSISISNQASYTYSDSANGLTIQGVTGEIVTNLESQQDPLGRVTGCAGEILANYTGISVGLYEVNPSDPTGTELGDVTALTQTELPDLPGNSLPRGATPNTQNSNPFFLTNGEQGTYNFLLDPRRGQLDQGRTYILVVNPPPDSIYDQRQFRIVIGQRNGEIVSYTATSLDGKPVSTTDSKTSVNGTITIREAEQVGLVVAILDLNTSICQAQEIQITKTGDRAAAEPGDTVIYRLSIRNLASTPLNNLVVTDTLPLGFQLLAESVRGELEGTLVPITTSQNGSTVTMTADGITLPVSERQRVLNIVYAARLTPDALRGTGQNSAIVNGERADNGQDVKDGPVTHRMRLGSGILSDCGTLIGRVFVDKNFDGEQQPGEAGIPNAVIFLDDGNRITTDANGLFSVANVISGYRTGVLDLTSLPGYTLAPNLYFKERNSPSRLVHLQPGGLGRMNFAVTPTYKESDGQ